MKKETQKNLSLRTETLRSLSGDAMAGVAGGGKPWYCWTVVIPSSGVSTAIPITLTKCKDEDEGDPTEGDGGRGLG